MQAYPRLWQSGSGGEKRDEPEETKSQPTLAASHRECFPNHLQMGGPPLLFVQDSWAPYLFSCSILAFTSFVSGSSQLLCPEAIPQVWTSTPYLTAGWIWKGFVILALISALNPTPGESSDLRHPFAKGLASACVSLASSGVHCPKFWRAVANLIRREGLYFVIPRNVSELRNTHSVVSYNTEAVISLAVVFGYRWIPCSGPRLVRPLVASDLL